MTEPLDHPRLPDYEFDRVLGRGGMGTVYLYRHAITGRPEVVKLLSPEVLDRPINRGRFEREIRAAFKLAHPNIVAAYSTHRVGDALAFCMEYVEGDDLMRVVQRDGPLPPGVAAGYAVQALYGLQHAHEQGMVHRDIKPGNLMRTTAGGRTVIKVVDFGLAKLGSDPAATSDTNLTQYGQVLGTPDFIAPEQIRDTSKADIRSDIYSLGCSLYFLLTGRPPFKGDSLYDLFEMHIHAEAPPLHLIQPEVSAELSAVVARLMAKDPAARPQTPLAAAELLLPFAQFGTHSAPALLLPADTGPTMATLSTSSTPPLPPPSRPDLDPPSDQYLSLTPTTISPPVSTRYKPVKPAPPPPRGLPGWVVPVAVGTFLLAGVGAVVLALRDWSDGTMKSVPTPIGTPPSGSPQTGTPPSGTPSSSTPPTGTPSTGTPHTTPTPATGKPVSKPSTPPTVPTKPTAPEWYTTLFGAAPAPKQTVWPAGDGWRLRDGTLTADDGSDDRLALFDLPPVGDFDLTAELAVSGGAGLIVRGDRRAAGEQPTGYLIGLGRSAGNTNAFHCGAVHRWGIKDGRVKHLAAGEPGWHTPGVPLKVRVKASGDRLIVQIDGKPEVQVRDADGYPGGRLGLATQAGGRVTVTALSLTTHAPPPADAATVDPGFVSLVQPDRLAGWEVEGEDRYFEAIGPILFGQQVGGNANTKGHLLTAADYADFVLRFEFLLKPDSAALVDLRARKGELAEVLVNGEKTHRLTHPCLRLTSGTDAQRPRPGSLERWFESTTLQPPVSGQAVLHRLPTDTWHQAEVRVEGQSIAVTLNGKPIEYPRPKIDPKRIDPQFPPGRDRASGRIGLCPFAGEVQFRHVRVKPL